RSSRAAKNQRHREQENGCCQSAREILHDSPVEQLEFQPQPKGLCAAETGRIIRTIAPISDVLSVPKCQPAQVLFSSSLFRARTSSVQRFSASLSLSPAQAARKPRVQSTSPLHTASTAGTRDMGFVPRAR